MAPPIRGPPGVKLLPSRYPELDLPNQWRSRFAEIMQTGTCNQDQALKAISRESGGVSISTIYFSIHLGKKTEYRKAAYNSWQQAKARPNFSRGRFNQHRADRDYVRRHLDDYLANVFQRLGLDQAHTLVELSDAIKSTSGVYFRPPTLLKISSDFEKRFQQPLLVGPIGPDQARYTLACRSISNGISTDDLENR